MGNVILSNRMRDAARISAGTVLGQAISVVTLPVITRIYGAEILGGWAAIQSISTILAYLCDLGMSQAIMLEEDEKIEGLYRVVTTISILVCLASLPLLFPYYALVLRRGVAGALIHSVFVAVYTFTFRQVQTCYIWLNREKEYRALMKNPIINYGSIAVCSIALGLSGFKTYGYYIGTTMGQLLTLLYMRRELPPKMLCADWSYIKSTVREHGQYVRFQMPAQLTAQARQQLPNLLIGGLFGDAVLGYFSVSQKLISIPVNLIGQALGKVFYQTLAELHRKGERIADFVGRNMSRAIRAAFAPMVLFAAFGDAAVVLFFGREYAVGGVISRIMVFRACFTFLSTALTGIDIVLGKQQYALITCAAQTVLGALGVIGSYYLTGNIYVCTLALVGGFLVVQILYYGKIYAVLQLRPGHYYRKIAVLLLAVLAGSYLLRSAFLLVSDAAGLRLLEWLKGFLVI